MEFLLIALCFWLGWSMAAMADRLFSKKIKIKPTPIFTIVSEDQFAEIVRQHQATLHRVDSWSTSRVGVYRTQDTPISKTIGYVELDYGDETKTFKVFSKFMEGNR